MKIVEVSKVVELNNESQRKLWHFNNWWDAKGDDMHPHSKEEVAGKLALYGIIEHPNFNLILPPQDHGKPVETQYRVWRILEYIGDRKFIDNCLKHRAIKGEHVIDGFVIREALLGNFPEELKLDGRLHSSVEQLENAKEYIRKLSIFAAQLPAMDPTGQSAWHMDVIDLVNNAREFAGESDDETSD